VAAVRLALIVGAVLGAFAAGAGPAWAQACCASAGLVIPSRLRSYEDAALGLQARARSVFGAFGPTGGYAGATDDASEWGFGQDLFGSVRVLERGQVAVLIPFVETRRSSYGTSSFGGGIGDVTVNLRYDFINNGERHPVPGVALLAGLLVPTGTPPEKAGAGDVLVTGATGEGSFEGIVGVGVESSWEPYFAGATALVGLRSPRRISGVRQTFAPRFTGLLAAGRTLPHGATVGVFASGLLQGRNSDDNGPLAGSEASLLTLGAAGTVSLSDQWRLQGSLSGSPPLSNAGRNQTAGIGLSVSILRLWL
jgi:hypothetical protein